MALTEAKCPQCGKQLGTLYEIPVEYANKHWHLSCLLDHLTEGPRLTDNPFSPIGGAGFHP
jgi:hypothetical protein